MLRGDGDAEYERVSPHSSNGDEVGKNALTSVVGMVGTIPPRLPTALENNCAYISLCRNHRAGSFGAQWEIKYRCTRKKKAIVHLLSSGFSVRSPWDRQQAVYAPYPSPCASLPTLLANHSLSNLFSH